MARPSTAAAAAGSPVGEKSWMYPVWITPSASAAAARRPSVSSSDPRTTSAPAAVTTAAALSDRASPTTWCPALSSSRTTTDPIEPGRTSHEYAHD